MHCVAQPAPAYGEVPLVELGTLGILARRFLTGKGDEMALPAGSRVAIVGFCTDPRFSREPGLRYEQLRAVLGVDWIVPLKRPGFVRFFQQTYLDDAEIHTSEAYAYLAKRVGKSKLQLRAEAWEDDFLDHYGMHRPIVLGVASHATCGGFPKNDDEQRAAAMLAADVLRERLKRVHNVTIPVVPLFEEKISDTEWFVHRLDCTDCERCLAQRHVSVGEHIGKRELQASVPTALSVNT